MSALSLIYDAMNADLEALYPLPTYRKLDNPYIVEENSSLILNRGWGFAIGSGSNTKRKIGCKLSIEREITLINTIVNRGTVRDMTIRESAEKQIMEDQFLAIKAFEKDPNISVSVAQYVSKMEFQGDNGIEYIFDDKTNFLVMRSSFIMEYFEDINS